MAATERVDTELFEEMVDRFGKSYNEMTSHRESLPHSKSLFEDIKAHFLTIQRSLEQKFDEINTKERAFEKMKLENRTLLEELEVAVGSMEQSLCDRLQEVRDAAVSAIIEARKNENKVSSSANDTLNEPFSATEDCIPLNNSSAATGKDEPRCQLKQLCEEMNVKGLLKFFSDHRRNIIPMRDELPIALRSASEPAHFVLKTLEGFYPQNPSNISPNSKEHSSLQALRRTSLLLMESAAPLFAMAEPGDERLLSAEIKQQAKVIANEWKPKLAELDLDASNGHSLEAQAFLQLLATFNISAEFDEDELCKLVIAMSSRHRQAPELCLAVGLAHKSQDVVETLITKGRLIDAVHFSYFFHLTEAFPLVPLLKRFMDETEETFTRSIATGLEREAANQELSALKTVVRCIDECKLQDEYPPLPLQTRIGQLERRRPGKKRSVDANIVPAKKHKSYQQRTFHRTPNRLSGPTVHEKTQYYATAPPGNAPYNHRGYAASPYYPPNWRVPPYRPSSNYASYAGPPMQSAAPGGNFMSSGMQPSPSNYGSYMGTSAPASQQSFIQYEE